MPTARYRTADGKVVPSTTTILRSYSNPAPLMKWAARLYAQGIDAEQERGNAARIGTMTHGAIDHAIHVPDASDKSCLAWGAAEAEVVEPELASSAATAFDAFRRWKKARPHIEVLETEVSLVSERYRFGGTCDAVARINGKLVVLDWKTGKNLYVDAVSQVASYAALWAEHRSEKAESAIIVRFDKEHGSAHSYDISPAVLRMAWRRFEVLLCMYTQIDRELRKVLKK